MFAIYSHMVQEMSVCIVVTMKEKEQKYIVRQMWQNVNNW